MAFNFSVILPLFATRDLDGTETTFTTMLSIMSLGSVVGALTIARRTEADTAFLARCALALGIAMTALAMAPGTAVAYLVVVPVGITSIMVVSGANAVVQLATAPAMRGRVLALIAVVFLGSTPIGGPITGWISEVFGARWALALGAATSLLAGALTLRALHGGSGARAGRLDEARLEPGPVVAPGR
jgi:MFS family permease